MFEQYEHHGTQVWVRGNLKGLYKEHCLCYSCTKFKPGTETNCRIANLNFAVCLAHHIVTPVYECPEFEAAQ